MRITKRKFRDYEVVRRSGVTNMTDVGTVSDLSNRLTDDEAAEIRGNYSSLSDRFPFSEREDAKITEDATELRSNFC